MKPSDLYVWLFSTCSLILDTLKVQFTLGVLCPLGDDCHRDSMYCSHIVDLHKVKGLKSMFCGEVRVDTMKSMKHWLPSVSLTSEGLVRYLTLLVMYVVSNLLLPGFTRIPTLTF